MPESMPADCQDLIRRMLQTDPKRRATIEEIRIHPWVNKGKRVVSSNL